LDTPLHVAAEAGKFDAVRLLVELWPEGIRAKERWENTPLHIAAQELKIDVVRLLVHRWPEGKEEINNVRKTPLSLFLRRADYAHQQYNSILRSTGRHDPKLWMDRGEREEIVALLGGE
jgi:ankyrin repeat protein